MDEEVTLWVATRFGNLKWHYGPKRLAHGLLEEGGADIENVEMRPADEGLIDLPGMIMMDRSYQKIKVDTFRLVIPTEDFEHFYDELVVAPLRKFKTGEEYHKLHGWVACVMFTPQQHEALGDVMEEMLPDVRHVAEKEAREFSRRIAQINRDDVKVVAAKTIKKGQN